MEIKEISIEKIKPDKNQPRKTFDKEILQGLAESILGNGLLNPIEIDSDYVITDGERRWRACKLAGLKIVTCRIVKVKDETEKLRRQLIYSLQDEEISTDEKYNAIVKLWKMEKKSSAAQDYNIPLFAKELGINQDVVRSAFDYCEFAEEEPELAKQVSARVIADTKSLPREERLELIKEFKNIPKEEKKTELMRELVKVKKKEIENKKLIEEYAKSKTDNKKEIKIITDRERLFQMRDEIIETHNRLNSLVANIKWVRKTKFYLAKPKEKENFIKFIESASERARKWADELDDLKENIEIELIKE